MLGRRRRNYGLRVVAFLLLAVIASGATKKPKKKKKTYPDYIYQENAGPVVDFKPEHATNPEHPAFLFSSNNRPRVVEFYSPVCPHVSAQGAALLVIAVDAFTHDVFHSAESFETATSTWLMKSTE